MKKIMKALGKVTLDVLYVVSVLFLIMSLFELLSPAAGMHIAKFREIPWAHMFSPYFVVGICLMLHQYCANKYDISYILPYLRRTLENNKKQYLAAQVKRDSAFYTGFTKVINSCNRILLYILAAMTSCYLVFTAVTFMSQSFGAVLSQDYMIIVNALQADLLPACIFAVFAACLLETYGQEIGTSLFDTLWSTWRPGKKGTDSLRETA